MYLIGGGTASIYAGSGLTADMPVTDDPVRDWKSYIDLLTQYGINFVRFDPWDFLRRSEIPDYASPWLMTSGKSAYDLSSFNPEYWGRLKEIILSIKFTQQNSQHHSSPFLLMIASQMPKIIMQEERDTIRAIFRVLALEASQIL